MPIAELKKVTKRYGAVAALDDVSLEVRSGEVLAVLGPNGAGKTTSVHLLMGLIQEDAGKVRLFGTNPRELEARRRTGVMLQVSGVPGTLTVCEHLELFAAYYPRPLPLSQAIACAGLDGLEKRRVGKLSGGQRQRLMFALALIGDAELLFLDEPTVGLDVTARRRFWQTIRELAGRGRTIVLTTHYLEEADALADRIVVLNKGEVVANGAPDRIKARVAASRVRCRTTADVAVIDSLPEVRSASRDGAELELFCTAAEPVVQRLLQLDPDMTGLEVTGAGLEQAFLELTGSEGQKAA